MLDPTCTPPAGNDDQALAGLHAAEGGGSPMNTSYDPLHDPERDTHVVVPPLETAIERARKVLAEKSEANIHDRDAMIRAAYGLHYVLHDLLTALAAESGDRR
ncbi:hypothetical protein ACWDUG_21530 [Streptomyces cellulosae]